MCVTPKHVKLSEKGEKDEEIDAAIQDVIEKAIKN